jgi:hypothetical protein
MASEEDFLASSIIGRNVHVICAEENRGCGGKIHQFFGFVGKEGDDEPSQPGSRAPKKVRSLILVFSYPGVLLIITALTALLTK